MGSRVMAQYGPKLGGHIMKAGMTATMASMPAAETIVSGLTSKDGMTLQKGEDILSPEYIVNGEGKSKPKSIISYTPLKTRQNHLPLPSPSNSP